MSADDQKDSAPRRFTAEEAKERAKQAQQKAEFILSRAYGLVRDPKLEWDQIRREETTIASILLGYVAPLAAVPPLCGLIGGGIFGQRFGDQVVRTPLGEALVSTIVDFGVSILLVYLLGLLIEAIAENFDGQRDTLAAQKVAAYSMTPAFLSGVFWLWPPLAWLSVVAIGMSAYLLYRGLPPLMKCPELRAQSYAATIAIAGLVAFVVLFAMTGCITGANGL